MLYWKIREGRWICIFVVKSTQDRNMFGDLKGNIYNLRRKYSHKKVRLCWKNLSNYRTNIFTEYTISDYELNNYEGPFNVFWN